MKSRFFIFCASDTPRLRPVRPGHFTTLRLPASVATIYSPGASAPQSMAVLSPGAVAMATAPGESTAIDCGALAPGLYIVATDAGSLKVVK